MAVPLALRAAWQRHDLLGWVSACRRSPSRTHRHAMMNVMSLRSKYQVTRLEWRVHRRGATVTCYLLSAPDPWPPERE